MRWVALIIILCITPACTMMESIKKAAATTTEMADTTRELIGQANILAGHASDALAKAKTEYAIHAAKADIDKSGDTSGWEWVKYILLGLGVAGTGGAGAMATRNARSDARKTRIEDRLARIEMGK